MSPCQFYEWTEATRFPRSSELGPFLPGGQLATHDIEDLVRRPAAAIISNGTGAV